MGLMWTGGVAVFVCVYRCVQWRGDCIVCVCVCVFVCVRARSLTRVPLLEKYFYCSPDSFDDKYTV